MVDVVPRELTNSLGLSVREACARSSIGRTTFYKLLKCGQIPAHKCGRRTVILPDELRQALESLPTIGGKA
jgi:excisionase family DNA binding protein